MSWYLLLDPRMCSNNFSRLEKDSAGYMSQLFVEKEKERKNKNKQGQEEMNELKWMMPAESFSSLETIVWTHP